VSADAAPVRAALRGRLGVLTLDRPRTINALDHAMVRAIAATLAGWAEDDAVGAVLMTGAGDRGLCAGGDVVGLREALLAGDPDAPAAFWRDEYALNALIASYPKPYVAFMDGIVLGGGVGISAHGSHRIVTERSRIGMPETGIGFAPDVGGTRLLARAPGELGTHLGLTGAPVGPGDAIALGLADAFVPAERLPALAAALETAPPDDAVAAVAAEPPAAELAGERPWIDAAYAGDDAAAILVRLAAGPEPAREAAALIATRSPTSVAATLRALRLAAAEPSLEVALARELRTSIALAARPDFAEGVRAQLVDKDRAPRWRPASLADVDPADVDRIVGGGEPNRG
jgi:enoyl-CoA hydratase